MQIDLKHDKPLLNSGNTETYELIEKIKIAHQLDSKFKKKELQSIEKLSLESPKNYFDTQSESLSK